MPVTKLDHLVLYVENIDRAVEFYTEFDGIESGSFGDDRKYLDIGDEWINLRQTSDSKLVADRPTAGAADLCLLTDTPIDEIQTVLRDRGIDVLKGPVHRSGASGLLLSVYFRDPEGNLVEFANRRE
ncbi:VOC family protein [Natronorubrum sp. FCH18a]|uniref:VOC family protein n=1 Tax=Natronorubrum sp. FCH18a TaxID=3447018 RepID=UPI003F50D4E5